MTLVKENKLSPSLRYDEFKENWSLSKIKEISLINPTHNNLPNSFIYIDLESVKKGVLKKKNLISKKSAPSRAQRLLKSGDILYQSVRPYQKNNYFFDLDGDYVASTGYLQIKTTINNKYLYQYFHNNTFVNKVLKLCTGANYPTINSKDFGNIEIAIPSNSEQNKIAEFLSSVDKKIQLLEKKKEKLGLYKKGVMQKIFSQKIRFKENNGNEFPDWEEKKLGEFSKLLRGHSYNSTNVKDSGLLVLRSSNIKNGRLVLDKDLQFVNKKCKEEILLMNKDIVICMANGSKNLVGKSAVYFGDYQEKITIGAFCSIMRSELELSRYILQSVQFKRYLHTLLAGTNINNLKNSELSELKFWIPCSKDEQKKITNFLATIDKKIESVNIQIKKTKEFKKGLLQQMFV